MSLYDFECSSCGHLTEESHPMGKATNYSQCEVCGKRSQRTINMPFFKCHGDDLGIDGKPIYCPALARKLPYGKDDPKAFFSSKYKAREAARRKASSSDDYKLELDD